jgi:hypothetical protein
MLKKYLLVLLFIFYYSQTFANDNEIIKELNTNQYEMVYSNTAILKCGQGENQNIYSSFDIKVILSISNAISSQQIPLTTNWDYFHSPAINMQTINEKKLSNLPLDIKRILFLCLTWNESERLNLFTIPDSALENIATRLEKERPWKKLDHATSLKADNLSKDTLKEFIYIVLRANVFESVRGNLENNKSLWFMNWSWLINTESNIQ